MTTQSDPNVQSIYCIIFDWATIYLVPLVPNTQEGVDGEGGGAKRKWRKEGGPVRPFPVIAKKCISKLSRESGSFTILHK